MKIPILTIIIGCGLTAIGLFLTLTFLPIFPPSQKYDVLVNPILIKGSLGTESHVEIKNTGSEALTNVTIYYSGTAKHDIIPTLDPGQRIFLSPPQGSDLMDVRVTSDQGINITKPYTTPVSVPFVGNSGFGG